MLKTIPDSPLILTCQDPLESDSPCKALVGSTNTSSYGMDIGGYLTRSLAGMTSYIATADHQVALAAAGKTSLFRIRI